MTPAIRFLFLVLLPACLASSPPSQLAPVSASRPGGELMVEGAVLEEIRTVPSRETCRAVGESHPGLRKFLRDCLNSDKRDGDTIEECIEVRLRDVRAIQREMEHLCSYSDACQQALQATGQAGERWVKCFRERELRLKVHEEICEDEEREIDRAAGVEFGACK